MRPRALAVVPPPASLPAFSDPKQAALNALSSLTGTVGTLALLARTEPDQAAQLAWQAVDLLERIDNAAFAALNI